MSEDKNRSGCDAIYERSKENILMTLRQAIMYGSCVRGDFAGNSDIDIMLLLDIAQEKVGEARKQILDQLDLEYDVVLYR